MRCGCPQCGTYMVQREGLCCACVCPACGFSCSDCMGTGAPPLPGDALEREAQLRARIRAWEERLEQEEQR